MKRIVPTMMALAMLAAPARGAARVALLVDESGSMRSYFDDGTVRSLASDLHATLAESVEIQLIGFTTDLRRRASPAELACGGARTNTLIDRALLAAMSAGFERVWILTDNVQDSPTAAEAGSTHDFYEVLRSPRVSGVVLFPIPQSPGRGGLVLYGMLIAGGDAGGFTSEIERVHAGVRGLKASTPLRMKPFDRDVVGVTMAAIDTSQKLHVGRSIGIPLRVRFLSRLEHLRIAGARVAPADTPVVFPPQSLFSLETGNARITPEHVALEPGEQSATVYDVMIDLGEIRLKPGFGTLWEATFGKTHERYRLDFRFDLSVPRDSFELRREILARYGAETIADARASGRVYALSNFPALAGEETTTMRAGIPLPIDVAVPAYASVIVIGSLLLGLAVLGGLGWLIAELARQGGGVPWTVVAKDLGGAQRAVEVAGDGSVRVDRALIGRILKDDRFEPAAGCRVPGSPGRAKISGVQAMRLMLASGKQLDLSFIPKRQGVPASRPLSGGRKP